MEMGYQCKVALSFIPKINRVKYLSLFERVGGINNFFIESDFNIKSALSIYGNKLNIDRDYALKMAAKEVEIMEREGISILSFEDPSFPQYLLNCIDAPLVLFYKGDLDLSGKKILSIVGTRRSSERCRRFVAEVIEEISSISKDVIIVSGLAYGIDIKAHVEALRVGLKTIAIFGTGLNRIYPAQHSRYAEEILRSNGALVSEFNTSDRIHKINFIGRNRIIAGVCDILFVAESGIKGGAMSTAYIANSYSKDVYALPGRSEDEMSKGCNKLIRENIAALADSSSDLLTALQLSSCSPQSHLHIEYTMVEESILAIVREVGDVTINTVIAITNFSYSDISLALLNLEISGTISILPGGKIGLNI